MRLERQASRYYAHRTSAELLAREGVESLKAILLEATGTNRVWASRPGEIVSSTNSYADPSSSAVTNYFLSSGTNTNETQPLLRAANLNRSVLSDDGRSLITGDNGDSGIPMPASWVYVRRDGSRETNAAPDSANVANPIIGRYAFWADDESARINLNTAWQRGNNTNALSSPSLVNLLALDGMTKQETDLIYSNALLSEFNTPDDVRSLDGDIATLLSGTNRFFVTQYSHSDQALLTPWGQPKIFLTTQKKNLPGFVATRPDASNYYLDILNGDNLDPGVHANLSSSKIASVLQRLTDHFGRELPYASGSLRDKYGYKNSVQIALDLMEYVRSAESTNAVVSPIRLTVAGTNSFVFTASEGNPNSVAGESPNILIGSSRRPMITEIATWFDPVPTRIPGPRWVYNVRHRLEFCLPKKYGITPAQLEGYAVKLTSLYPRPDGAASSLSTSVEATPMSGATIIENGDYTMMLLDIGPVQVSVQSAANTNRPSNVWTRIQFLGGAGLPGPGFSTPFWELAPAYSMSDTNLSYTNFAIKVPVNDLSTFPAATSAQVADPRLNKYQTNWIGSTATWGAVRRQEVGDIGQSTLPVSPRQDSDNNRVSDAGMAVPPPAGDARNPRGVVSSIGELGFVPTGLGANVPWRSLRLQPGGGSPPDWVLVDLFTLPKLGTNSTWSHEPHPGTLGGQININAAISPFFEMNRLVPLKALFLGARTNTSLLQTNGLDDSAATMTASNVASMRLASGGISYGNPDFYSSIGQLSEIQGVSDAGEQSEEVFRQVADLAALQGNVYRGFSIGQALQQTPDGRLLIQAEKFLMVQLERFSENGDVKTRVVYWRNIGP